VRRFVILPSRFDRARGARETTRESGRPRPEILRRLRQKCGEIGYREVIDSKPRAELRFVVAEDAGLPPRL
jgi:hypothetical protein